MVQPSQAWISNKTVLITLIMTSILRCTALTTTIQKGSVLMGRVKPTFNGGSFLSMSSSSFVGGRQKKYFPRSKIALRKGFGARSEMTMWGESSTEKSFSSWYDDDNDAENSSKRSRQKSPARNDESGENRRNFRKSSFSGDSGSGWDDFAADNDGNSSFEPYEYQRKSASRGNPGDRRNRSNTRGGDRGRFERSRRNDDSDFSNDRRTYKRKDPRDRKEINAEIAERKVNMKALEKAGFDHLYGIAPVLNALTMEKRDFNPEEDATATGRKPEAQFTPYLFVQNSFAQDGSGSRSGGKAGDKAKAVKEILNLVENAGVPVAYADKGVLNALSNNRPHQGFVLRCRSLDFEPLSRIPYPDGDASSAESSPIVWLVLDEVVDPQNFGALLRSAYFLGSSSPDLSQIGVLVCAKNSSPASPSVSAASAGALELMKIHSTGNLPRTLNTAVEDGWRVIGAAAEPLVLGSNSDDGIIPCTNLMDLALNKNEPTILVLGSEGHGLRNLVARACTEFVRIPSGASLGFGIGTDEQNEKDDSVAGVDSLNVSVTGGILLWTMVKGVLN